MKSKIHLKEITSPKGIIKVPLIKNALLQNDVIKVISDILSIKNVNGYWDSYTNGKEIQRYIRKEVFSEDVNNSLRAEQLKSILDDILVDPRFTISNQITEESVLFKNTDIDIYTLKPLDKSIETFYTYRIEATFLDSMVPSNEESILGKLKSTRFIQLLEEMFPNDICSQQRLLELLGYLLCPITKHKKAVLFIGKPNTGKSLLLKIIRSLLPSSVISNLDLSLLGRHNANSPLLNAQLNITEDYDSNASVDMSMLKRIIGNEIITVSQKYQPDISTALRTKLILVGNAFPKIKDSEITPFSERMLFLRFDKVAEVPNPNLIDELKKELDEIATACVIAYSKSLSRGFTESEVSQQWFINQLYENQSEKLFIEDMITLGTDTTFIPIADLKRAYSIYCNINGFAENSMSTTRNAIHDRYPNVRNLKKNMSKKNIGNIHCLNGIKWNMDELAQLDTELFQRATKIQENYFIKKGD